ncbi:MAG: M20/M25/M40 family metallo-hydrolase [Polyangiaceae bacterium]|nr:M20/M25/M40 family metallo-hydrolase [Polyangiaceae bacterium]
MAAIEIGETAGETLELFKALLRIDTTNPPGNERPAAELLARLFEREGIEHTLVESAPTRASIVARLRGTGDHGPLLLNGHLDVVPVDRESWSCDPFAAHEADGFVWGRGAIDMKNMVAMSAMTLVALKRSGIRLTRDLIFAGVADEEAGSNHGALYLVQQHPELVRAEYVLNEVGGHTLHMGASRFYPVQVSEKGICWFELVATGDPGHGSMPHSNNAVVKLSRAIQALGDTRLPQRVTPVVDRFLRTLARGAPFPQSKIMPLMLEPRLAGFLLDTLERQNPDQARGINAMLRNTVSPTILRAGRKVNVIPSEARAELDGRVMPGTSVGEFLAEVQEVIGRDLRLNVLEQHDGTVFRTDTPLYDAIVKSIDRHDPGGTVVPYMIPGFTDSFAYARLGATCYGFSPVRLPPELNFTRMYHGHDERIPIDGFVWGFGVLSELVREFCSAG